MAIEENVEAVNKELQKTIKYLTGVYDVYVKLNGASAKTSGNLGFGGGGSTSSITSTGSDAQFSSETTASSMPKSSWKSKAAGVASMGLGLAEFAYNVTPGLTDALNHQNSLFSTAFAGNSYSNDRTFGKIRAAFSGAFDSATGPNEAAALATGRGLTQNNASFGRVMGEAGFMSKMTGMSNVSSASGAVGLQAGVGGAAGKLAQVGIFTNDLTSGSYKGLGDVIDQLWERSYGSKSAKVPLVKFDADILGGYLGRDLANLFGDQPELLNMVKEGMRLKAKAGGMAGINFDNAAKGPKSANALAKKMGMTESNTPYLTSMRANEARAGAISTASDSLIKGFQMATEVLIAFNGKLEELGRDNGALGQLYDKSMQLKGAFETLAGDTGGSAMLGLAFAGLYGIVSRLTGGIGGLLQKLGIGAKPTPTAPVPQPSTGTPPRTGTVEPPAGGAPARGGFGPRTGVVTPKGGVAGILATIGVGLAADQFMPEGPIKSFLFGEEKPGGRNVFEDLWNGVKNDFTPPWMREPAGAGATDTLSRSAQGAVEWAGQSTAGKETFPGICDHFVGRVYGQANSGYDNAKAHWTATPDRLRHSKDTKAPLGSLVYWNNGKDGHVAVVTGTDGDGNPLITTTHTNGGTPTVMPLSQATRELGGKGMYNGWAVPYFQGKTAALDGVTASSAPAQASATAVPGALGGSGPGDVEYAMKNMHKMRSINMTGVSNPIMAAMQKSTQPSTVYGGIDEAQAARDEEYSAINRSGVMSTPRDDASTTAAPSAGVPRGKSKLLDTLMAAGFKGENLREAWAVAMRESGGRADAHNPDRSTGDNSYGMFQINMLDQLGKDRDKKFKQYVDGYTGPDSLFDPLINARAAAYMTQKGKNWYHWDIDKSGYDGGSHSKKYQHFYAQYPGASAGMMVANDQLVNVHQGETIMSAETSQDFRTAMREVLSGGRGRGGDVNITLHIDKASDEEATRFANKVMELMKSDSRTERLRMR